MSGKLPNAIPLLSFKNIVERLRNYAVQQEVFTHDNKRVSKELNELANEIENGQNAANSVEYSDPLVYSRLAHRNKFRIGYHFLSFDPNGGRRKVFHHVGGTILDAINFLLQANGGRQANDIVLEDWCED